MLKQTYISNSYFAFPSLPGVGEGKFRNWNLPCYSKFFSIKFWFAIPVNYYLLLFVFTYFLPLFWCHTFSHDVGMKISLPKSRFLFPFFHFKPLFLYLISSLLTGSFFLCRAYTVFISFLFSFCCSFQFKTISWPLSLLNFPSASAYLPITVKDRTPYK